MKPNSKKAKPNGRADAKAEREISNLRKRIAKLEKPSVPRYRTFEGDTVGHRDHMRIRMSEKSSMAPSCQAAFKTLTSKAATAPPPLLPVFDHWVGYNSTTTPTNTRYNWNPNVRGSVVAATRSFSLTTDANGNACFVSFSNFVGLQSEGVWYTDGTVSLDPAVFANGYNSTTANHSFQKAEPAIPDLIDPYDGDALNSVSDYILRAAPLRNIVTVAQSTAAASERRGVIWAGTHNSSEAPNILATNVASYLHAYGPEFFDESSEITITGGSTAYNMSYGTIINNTSIVNMHSDGCYVWARGLAANSQLIITIDAAYFVFGPNAPKDDVPTFIPFHVWVCAFACLFTASPTTAMTQNERPRAIKAAKDQLEKHELASLPTSILDYAGQFVRGLDWRTAVSHVLPLLL